MVFDTDPTGWRLTTWWLYTMASAYLVGFLLFWSRFRRLERRATRGTAEDVVRYNRALRGFPNAIYAKQFGKKPFETEAKPKAEGQGRTSP